MTAVWLGVTGPSQRGSSHPGHEDSQRWYAYVYMQERAGTGPTGTREMRG